jgi:hypothetical protein
VASCLHEEGSAFSSPLPPRARSSTTSPVEALRLRSEKSGYGELRVCWGTFWSGGGRLEHRARTRTRGLPQRTSLSWRGDAVIFNAHCEDLPYPSGLYTQAPGNFLELACRQKRSTRDVSEAGMLAHTPAGPGGLLATWLVAAPRLAAAGLRDCLMNIPHLTDQNFRPC